MAYEEILFAHDAEAEPLLRLVEEEGQYALLDALRTRYWPDLTRVIRDNELRLYSDDTVLTDGLFIAWWNAEDGYVGFAKRLHH